MMAASPSQLHDELGMRRASVPFSQLLFLERTPHFQNCKHQVDKQTQCKTVFMGYGSSGIALGALTHGVSDFLLCGCSFVDAKVLQCRLCLFKAYLLVWHLPREGPGVVAGMLQWEGGGVRILRGSDHVKDCWHSRGSVHH